MHCETFQPKSGDRSGLAKFVIEMCGMEIKAVLAGLAPVEEAITFDYVFKHIVQTCSPAVRRGNVIDASAKYIAPEPQVRKGQPCPRPN